MYESYSMTIFYKDGQVKLDERSFSRVFMGVEKIGDDGFGENW